MLFRASSPCWQSRERRNGELEPNLTYVQIRATAPSSILHETAICYHGRNVTYCCECGLNPGEKVENWYCTGTKNRNSIIAT